MLEGAAEALARALFAPADAAEAWPFWADGGLGPGARSVCAPGRHLLAADPDWVERTSVGALGPGALVPWLRERLPVGPELGTLTVVGLAYDAGRNLERVPDLARLDPPLPDAVVARYPAYLEAQRAGGPWQLRARDAPSAQRLRGRVERLTSAWAASEPPGALVSSMTRAEHRRAVDDVRAGIRAGDLYQANVARRLEAQFDPAGTPGLYARLRRRNPASFGALWAMGPGTWVASGSPECLLAFDPVSREAHSYPIKGTRGRGASAAEDQALGAELLADPKERAEHVMIVDLVRNDLGRVAQVGSVHVPTLLGLETLPTVHHLVSDVAARVRPEHDLADVLAALFPGGSVTGAPKIAAMARIERVERLRRGFYTGSVGVIDGTGRAVFNLLIRTAIAADGRLFYQTGGGIVADSDPEREWVETELKALALMEILAAG